jgi:hypothetical protein
MAADRKRILQLEAVIKQMLQPLKGIPLDLIIEGFSGAKVIAFDEMDHEDQALRVALESAARQALDSMRDRPIKKRRANEVGNAIEPYVRDAILLQNLRVETPSGKSGRAQSAGYPDLLVFDAKGRPTYIECKTFSKETLDTTFRAFYLSPSSDFKASLDARHLLLAFEMVRVGEEAGLGVFTACRAKLLCLSSLLCDVKYEFNASNRQVYAQSTQIFEIGLDDEMRSA